MNDENVREEIPEVEPVEEVHRPAHPCPHCGGHDFSRGLMASIGTEPGQLGVEFMATGALLGIRLIGKEPLHVTLCNQCGTIVRMYVINKDREWRRWPR